MALDEKKVSPKKPSASDPYAHRAYRIKYQLGYGAEGAARGEVHVGGDKAKVSPRDDSDKYDESHKEEDHPEPSYKPAQQE